MESRESVGMFHCGEDVMIGNIKSACTSNLIPCCTLHTDVACRFFFQNFKLLSEIARELQGCLSLVAAI